MRVEHGTRFYDDTDERCFFNKIVLERGGYNPTLGRCDDDLIIGFVQCYDGATGEYKRYCGRFSENDPAASIGEIMQTGSKFDDTMQEWFRAVERSKNSEI
ncbi:hypothetical protein [Psychrobacter communis]|uniref:Uncharacterized protein n=1 Tax=Psychrobacter communis TaxID=2762238 RepID=A0ABR8RLX5_9GAMM|nr:hypothetical protein [Psychrobacter communis]MBD7948751.1 hypothetical protein [Psychrobacter communis]